MGYWEDRRREQAESKRKTNYYHQVSREQKMCRFCCHKGEDGDEIEMHESRKFFDCKNIYFCNDRSIKLLIWAGQNGFLPEAPKYNTEQEVYIT